MALSTVFGTEIELYRGLVNQQILNPYSSQRTLNSLLLVKDIPEHAFLLGNIMRTATVLEDLIHLFESLTLGLGNTEPDPDEGKYTEDGKEDVCTESSFLNEGRGNETDDEVVDPV